MALGGILAAVRMKGKKDLLPYTLDFSTLANGAMPAPFTGATWTIASGEAKNTPGSTELLQDRGFETDWGGWWEAVAGDGAAAIDTVVYHSGAKSAKLTAGATKNTLTRQYPTVVPGSWVTLSLWSRGDGTNYPGYVFADYTNYVNLVVINPPVAAAWAQSTNLIHIPYNCILGNISATSPWADPGAYANYDDFSVLQYTPAQLFALSDFKQALVMVKARWSIATGDVGGVVACADALSNPQNYVYAWHDGTNAHMAKVVGGTFSADLISAAATYVDQADLEIRHTAATKFQLWYNNVQIGAEQTISDAGIVSNTIHGLYGVGNTGNSHCHLFAVAPVAACEIVFLGGSITAGANASDAAHRYVNLTMEYLKTHQSRYGYSWYNAGVGATGSWWALFRLAADVIAKAPDVVSLDWSVNDFDRLSSKGAAEACIRLLRTALPNVRLCGIHFLNVAGAPGADPTNTLEAVKLNVLALFNHYNIPWIDFAADIQALVAGGADLSTYLADQVHPTDAGHARAAAIYETTVANQLAGGGGSLPARLYDNGDYENTPIIRNGTDNDGETGTGWSTVGGTARQSSTADDTIKWTGTFQSAGIDGNHGVGAGVLAIKVDGAAYNNINLSSSALAYLQAMWDGSGFRGGHTITIKVVSGTVKINRFLAV